MNKLILSAIFLSSAAFAFHETLYEEWGQTFEVGQILFEEKTEFQDMQILENSRFGRILTLDGVLQTTEADEFVYHEMIVHVPMFAHPNPESVLIIGGGDGGALREVLRHSSVKLATMVDIDGTVVELSKKFLPSLSNGAFDDPRTELVIMDANEFIRMTDTKYDVIICDTTDPIGPARVLFTSEFYGACKSALQGGGILTTQGGVPFMQSDEFVDGYKNLSEHFAEPHFFVAPVPTYVGGHMAFGFGTDDTGTLDVTLEELEARRSRVEGPMKYYNPAVHKAAFALPQFMENLK